jgi:hypothetical protein
MSEWREYKLGEVATINDDSIKRYAQRAGIAAVGERYSVAHGLLLLNEVTKVDDIFYCRSEFRQTELMPGFLLKLKDSFTQPQLLHALLAVCAWQQLRYA